MKTRLFLFDIDGTLIASGGAGEKALTLAIKERFGANDSLEGIEIAGRTDTGIARRIFERYGVEPNTENLTGFLDCYLRHLETRLPATKGGVLPGILQLLEELKKRPAVAVALLTGNIRAGAKLKLTHYGVWHFFEFGAFADDHHNRNRLGKFAQDRARETHGAPFAPDQIFVLGDTPHDIDCGKAFGAKTVAIATGRYSVEELRAHRPDFLFQDLSNVADVLSTLGL